MNKSYYFIILFICALGLLLSFFFFPSFEQTSLMLLYNKQYQTAYGQYEELFNKGNHSLSVVIPLIKLDLQHARTNQAIERMELFVQENPGSLDARQYLGKLYQDNRRPYEYLLNLREIYRLDPQVGLLREQLYLYSVFDDIPHQMETLQEIFKHYKPLETEYYLLSYLYASQGKMLEALRVIRQMLSDYHPAMLEGFTIAYASHLFAVNGDGKMAYEVAARYIEADPDPQVASTLAYTLLNQKLPQEALHLLSFLPHYEQQTDLIFGVRIAILLEMQDTQAAYTLLKKRFMDGALADNLVESLFELALQYKEMDTIEQIIALAPLDLISESTLVSLIGETLVNQRPDIIQELASQISESYLKRHPLLAFILELQKSRPSREEEKALYFSSPDTLWTDTQKTILARFYFLKGYDQLARKTIDDLYTLEAVEDSQLYPLAGLYLELGLGSKGLALLQQLRLNPTANSPNVEMAWLLLAAADGRVQDVLEWFANHPFSLSLLTDAYFASINQHQAFLAIRLASLLLDKDPSAKHEMFLATAFALNGQEEAALRIFENLYRRGEPVEDAYISALATIDKRKGGYAEKIRTLILAKLKTKQVSTKQKREFAYILADSGSKQEAIALFLSLAKQKPFDDPDVQALLGIWGDKPLPNDLQWIADHLRKAKGREKAKWIKYLTDINFPNIVLATVKKSELKNKAIARAYFNALTAAIYLLADKAKINPAYREEVKHLAFEQLGLHPSDERKRELAYTLMDQYFEKEAARIFLEMAQHKPFDDPDVQALLGIWGEKPTEEDIQWIESRAKETTNKEKAKWLKHLVDVHAPDRIPTLVSQEDLKEDAILDIALEALDTLKRRKESGALILSVLSFENRLERLHQLAKRAQDENQSSAAEEVYLKILSINSRDSEALKKIGQILFGKGSLTYAKFYLTAYLQEKPTGDYLSFYQYGDILKQEKNSKQARRFYTYALYRLNQLDKQESDVLLIKAQLLSRLNCLCSASKLYYALLQDKPFDKSLRADVMNFLIDMGEYGQAAEVLASTPETIETEKKKQDEESDEEGEINLKLAHIRLLQDTLHFQQALCLSKDVLAHYPHSPRVLTSIAGVKLAIGRWRRALEFLDAAILLDSENESYAYLEHEILLDYLSFFSLTGESRLTGILQRETFRRMQMETYLVPFTKMLLYDERDHIRLGLFTNSDGITAPFEGNRERGELTLIHYFEAGPIVRGRFFYGNRVVGAGIEITTLDDRGQWDFIVDYHKPNWDFIETTVQFGTTDRVRLYRSLRGVPRLETYVAGSLNRYNLWDVFNAVSTYHIEAKVGYTWSPTNIFVQLFGDDSSISLNYTLDAEYAFHVKMKRSPPLSDQPTAEQTVNGQMAVDQIAAGGQAPAVQPIEPFFAPLPFVNREDHTLFLSVTKRFSPFIAWDGYWGYLYNRAIQAPLTPTYGFNLYFGKKDWLMLHLEYDHGAGIQNATVDRYIAEVKYAF